MKISLGGMDQQHNYGSSALPLSTFATFLFLDAFITWHLEVRLAQPPESPHITPHPPVPPTLITAHHPRPPASPPPVTPHALDTRAAFVCTLNIYRTAA